jgi:hypothetical protein
MVKTGKTNELDAMSETAPRRAKACRIEKKERAGVESSEPSSRAEALFSRNTIFRDGC